MSLSRLLPTKPIQSTSVEMDSLLLFGSRLVCLLLVFELTIARGADSLRPASQVVNSTASKPLASVLSPAKWQEVEKSVDRALLWLSSHQATDGSFLTLPQGQPAVTSFSVMAFLSRGHQPGLGPYGQHINRAIDFVIASQKSDGLLSLQPPGPVHEDQGASHTAVYNHAISGLMLGEVYGQVSGQRAKEVKQAIERALEFSRKLQLRPKPANDKGGWRYLRHLVLTPVDADLSVTGWHLMFLRSAKNAQFDVPQVCVDEAAAYVRRCWDAKTGMFNYALSESGGYGAKRAMTGAGILSLSLCGEHETPMARAAGDWLLGHPYKRFGELTSPRDRFFYGAYYCSQAMAQLGGHYWEQFFPPLADSLLSGQATDGSWPPEIYTGGPTEAIFGNVYTTALAVLSLTPPYQLLPVYQR
jgi:hypothetical protein